MICRNPPINRGRMGETMSWSGKLEQAQADIAARNIDPWRLPLERVRGKIDYDGLERVSSQTLLDILEVPQRSGCSAAARGSDHTLKRLHFSPQVSVQGSAANCSDGRGPFAGYLHQTKDAPHRNTEHNRHDGPEGIGDGRRQGLSMRV